MKITKIQKIARKNKYQIYVDNNYAFSLSKKALDKFGLTTGKQIESENLSELTERVELYEGEKAILDLLDYRFRSKGEIQNKLKSKNFSPLVIEKLINKFETLGFINDSNFAEMYLRDLIKFHPEGKILLRNKLRSKGISSEIIDLVLEENLTAEVEQEMADRLLKKKLRSLERFEPKKRKQKALAFLQRKGFPYRIAKNSFDDLFED
ncbi:MAG: RecX family transcriptional regulator [Candidatus Cloacimonadota bacterium]|nr:RecX family transcriptional regulator [Candidatus Cloacimonadota bacterium]